jgi:uncharacterized membrane-anchored protein
MPQPTRHYYWSHLEVTTNLMLIAIISLVVAIALVPTDATGMFVRRVLAIIAFVVAVGVPIRLRFLARRREKQF